MSPLIWLYAKDEHLLRGLTITQEIFGGLFIEPGFIFSFTPGDRIGLSLSFLYRNISGIRGDGDYRGNPTMITDNLNGAGYSAFDTGITVKFNFQNSWGGGGNPRRRTVGISFTFTILLQTLYHVFDWMRSF
jgi:hypothetical protein